MDSSCMDDQGERGERRGERERYVLLPNLAVFSTLPPFPSHPSPLSPLLSNGFAATFAGADADAVLQGEDEDFAVADLAGRPGSAGL